MNSPATKKLKDAHRDLNSLEFIDSNSLLQELKSSQERGLSAARVRQQRRRFDDNQLQIHDSNPWYRRLFGAFINPFNGVLFILAMVSYFMDYHWAATGHKKLISVIIISYMILLSGLLRFFQESRSSRASEKLRRLVKTFTRVRRYGKVLSIPLRDLVPGDILLLEAGSMLPADVRLLKAKDLYVNQAALTGESAPVEKFREFNPEKQPEAFTDWQHLAFMGTAVVSGTGEAIVLRTGKNTRFGAIAKSISKKRPPTSFDRGVSSVSWLLIRFIVIMTAVVFLLNGIRKGDWGESLLFALAVAVGITPEMLPVIVTTNLAKGAISLAKHRVIIKNLNSIQNLGAMDLLCSDKTGTLTEDRIVLEYHLDSSGKESVDVLRYAYLNSYFQTGLKNMMDLAILQHGDGQNLHSLRGNYRKMDEIPFDFSRRRMSVIVQDGHDNSELITKGAVEEILAVCNRMEIGGKISSLTAMRREKIAQLVRQINEKGMRVLGIARNSLRKSSPSFKVEDEKELIFVGIASFLDPAKPSAAKALQSLHAHGIGTKILTGDNGIVTQFIARAVGLKVDGMLSGKEIEAMDDAQLEKIADEITIFHKLSPQQKIRVVIALRKCGHVVGFLGDGINDAGAMRDADVGISVNTATEIARESADILLLEKDLRVLESGVLEGRKIFGNIVKYIKMSTSSSFGNMLSVVLATSFLPFLPMLPLQILCLNLLSDFSQMTIPWDGIDSEYLQKPKQWKASSIVSFTLWMGPVSSLFDIITFALMWFIFGWNSAENPQSISLFHSGWFAEALLTQILIIHVLRTRKLPFFRSNASPAIYGSTILSLAIGLWLLFGKWNQALGFSRLPTAFFGGVFFIVICYILLAQWVKTRYQKHYGQWL